MRAPRFLTLLLLLSVGSILPPCAIQVNASGPDSQSPQSDSLDQRIWELQLRMIEREIAIAQAEFELYRAQAYLDQSKSDATWGIVAGTFGSLKVGGDAAFHFIPGWAAYEPAWKIGTEIGDFFGNRFILSQPTDLLGGLKSSMSLADAGALATDVRSKALEANNTSWKIGGDLRASLESPSTLKSYSNYFGSLSHGLSFISNVNDKKYPEAGKYVFELSEDIAKLRGAENWKKYSGHLGAVYSFGVDSYRLGQLFKESSSLISQADARSNVKILQEGIGRLQAAQQSDQINLADLASRKQSEIASTATNGAMITDGSGKGPTGAKPPPRPRKPRRTCQDLMKQ